MASQQATYVQISRAREETKLYIVAGERGVEREGKSLKMDEEQKIESLEQMKKSWSYNAAKDTTLEHIPREQEREIKQELQNDMDMRRGLRSWDVPVNQIKQVNRCETIKSGWI